VVGDGDADVDASVAGKES
jgi:hypothetical protein